MIPQIKLVAVGSECSVHCRLAMGSGNDVWQLLQNYWPVLLGNTLEWYEFAVYGHWTLQSRKGQNTWENRMERILIAEMVRLMKRVLQIGVLCPVQYHFLRLRVQANQRRNQISSLSRPMVRFFKGQAVPVGSFCLLIKPIIISCIVSIVHLS